MVLGVAAGLAVAGPLGGLLGGVAGHVLERWLRELLARGAAPTGDRAAGPAPDPAPDPADARRVAAATATIVLAAKLAKADGRVSRIEVDTFKEVFDIRDEDVGGIAAIFDEARQTAEGFEPHARQLAAIFAYEPGILEELLDQLFVLAAADGELDGAEIAWLARLAALFGLGGPLRGRPGALRRGAGGPGAAGGRRRPLPRARPGAAGRRCRGQGGLAAAGARPPSRQAGGAGRVGGADPGGQWPACGDQRRL